MSERETRFELATSTLARLHSTTELLPRSFRVGRFLSTSGQSLRGACLEPKRCFNRGGPFLLALLETVKGCAQGGCLFSFQEYPVSDAASDGLAGEFDSAAGGDLGRRGP
jgi:hypothetical protein